MIYWELFRAFFKIGLFAIGGGYATLPLIQQECVEAYAWLSLNEFNDLITISQMTPGPIAINSASFVGTVIAGPLGAIVATLACILPACLILSCLAYFYFKYRELDFIRRILNGLRPMVLALIASAGVGIISTALFGTNQLKTVSLNQINYLQLASFCLGFYLLRKKQKDPILVIFLAGLVSGIAYLVTLAGV
ncbi:MAG: chromate transporter [Eubacteriales bacterium]|nr:chromate transporter [Eubacteriales bacterium]